MDLTKPLLVLGSGGTLATGAYLTKDYGMPSLEKSKEIKSIKDALKGKNLISSIGGDSLAKQGEEEFESDSEAIKKLLKNDSLVKATGGKALEEWCSSQMSLNAEENKTVLENVEKYCLIRSVSNQLSRKGKNLLKTDVEDGGSATYKKRKSASSDRDVVGLTGGKTWNQLNESEDLKRVKEWCSDNSEKEFLVSEQGNSDLYTNVLLWCTQEGVA